MLLRVFLELAIKDYLQCTGELQQITKELKEKKKLPSHGMPPMQLLAHKITTVAKRRLSNADATMVEKALRHDPAAPFSINDLHAFVHHTDFPGERDILQFWTRTEPLFRLMLEQDRRIPKSEGSESASIPRRKIGDG